MITKDIIKLLENNELLKAKELTNLILLSKVEDVLEQSKREYALDLFSEGKKTKKAKVTDKDDDGEGMDPVGHGDDDIDNDGDSDKSDDYLKNRRKVIGKAIKKEEIEIPKVLEAITKMAKTKFGISRTSYDTKDAGERSQTKQQYYKQKEKQEKDKEADRKRKERETARRNAERSIRGSEGQ